MKIKQTILSLSSAVVVLFVLAGTTGITLIIHNCQVCEKFSVTSGIFLSPTEPEDNCCEAADRHCTPGPVKTVDGSCCHFKIERIRLTSFSPTIPLPVSVPADLTSALQISDIYSIDQKIVVPHELHNKHGGRYMITSNCQFLS